ncbi:hypothetical protein Nepgr_008469 [Nepenthes gracilis]|uniref:Uncharacterized protein n=1 Tax=Nepenthes gracilis TaxID=150966 RepID=A0AAD3XJA7_NEPGR|nr:hypothetical protein Nepgr_008469 [Nepenthes gracilis]
MKSLTKGKQNAFLIAKCRNSRLHARSASTPIFPLTDFRNASTLVFSSHSCIARFSPDFRLTNCRPVFCSHNSRRTQKLSSASALTQPDSEALQRFDSQKHSGTQIHAGLILIGMILFGIDDHSGRAQIRSSVLFYINHRALRH